MNTPQVTGKEKPVLSSVSISPSQLKSFSPLLPAHQVAFSTHLSG
jgi:hypothetical protein